MDLPIFEMNGVAISSMTDKELLAAIKQNEVSRNYPDSATTILVAEGVKRILSANIDLEEKRAEAREQVYRSIIDGANAPVSVEDHMLHDALPGHDNEEAKGVDGYGGDE